MNPYIGEIIMFGGNFAPYGWAFCDGQLLSIKSNEALFYILGTTYGGDGKTTFALPDLRGRVPMHPGQGPGLSEHKLGERRGVETVTLVPAEIPPLVGEVYAGSDLDLTDVATLNSFASETRNVSDVPNIYSGSEPTVPMAEGTVRIPGGGQAHNNMQPYSCVNFIIALQGIYPSE